MLGAYLPDAAIGAWGGHGVVRWSTRNTKHPVAVEKNSKGPPQRRGLGLRLRVWERGTDGTLFIGTLKASPEWDTESPDWLDAETKDILGTWEEGDSGRTYAGFSVDLVCANKLQDAWASASELRSHLLAVESLDAENMNYPLRPDRIFWDALQAGSAYRKAVREKDRPGAASALETMIPLLETLAREYPGWHADSVESKLREARRMRDDLPLK